MSRSRDHYKGVPKTRAATIDSQGSLKPLEKTGGQSVSMFGGGNLNAAAVTSRDDGEIVNVYVDSVGGNDNHNGLSPEKALKTLLTVRYKFPTHMINNSTIIVNLINTTTSIVEYPAEALHIGSTDSVIVNTYVYRGPPMIQVVTATGSASEALDSTPAVKVDQTGVSSGTGNRTRLDFTTAAPAWTTNDLAGNFLRVTRAGVQVFHEIPIVENTADTLTVDTLSIVGTLLATDIVEIVEPAVKIAGPAHAFNIVGLIGSSPTLGNPIADLQGANFSRISFSAVMAQGAVGVQFSACKFLTDFSSSFYGGSASFVNTVSLTNIDFLCTSAAQPVGRSDDAPISTTASVSLVVIGGTLFIGGTTSTVPRHASAFISTLPVCVYRATGVGVRVQGPGTLFLVDASLNGAGNSSVGVECRMDATANIRGGTLCTLTGTSGDLRVQTGAIISYGTGVGDFNEVAGWNGNFTRALEGTATAPTGDTSRITNQSFS